MNAIFAARREHAAALAVTLGLACGCWVLTVRQMSGMDMGVATGLGSFTSFLAFWVPMMAAMMLPAAAPAVSAFTRARRRVTAAPLFVASYIAVWTLFGVAAYALYEQHGYTAAGALTIAAGLYELTPLKRACRRRCRESVRSGFEFGFYCVGSSVGLMAILFALGVMSVTWTAGIAALVFAQKLLPPRTSVDVLVALGIVALGLLLVFVPTVVPALAGPM
jgi:predicted metal-binding membrane protein